MFDRVLRKAAGRVCLSLLVAGGCRGPLHTELAAVPAASAQRPRVAPKTIQLELVFVRHDDHDALLREEFWQFVDEQVFDEPLRRRLHANGLRAGVVTSRLPPHLSERFLPTAVSPGETLPAALPDNPALVRHVLNLLPGRGSDVLAATGLDELVMLEHDGDGVHGRTYRDASTLFTLRSWPAADGRVRLHVAPTIKHGPMERAWVGEEGMFRLETGQRRDVLDGLRFEAVVPTGSMLVVGCAGEAAATPGDALLRDRHGSRSGQRLLAIRPVPLAQTNDPLFAATESAPAGESVTGAEDTPLGRP